MKTRIGFVSNSSSTSFCIYGTVLSAREIKEIFDISDPDDMPIKKRNDKTGLGYWPGDSNYNDNIFIGRSWTGIKDTETGKKFKESVEEQLLELFKKEVRCRIYEESWYD